MAAQQSYVLVALSVRCLAVLLLISPCGALNSEVGYLSCIARDLDIDGFRVDVNHTLTHAYHLPPVVDDDDLIPLRDPCPTCPSSYNILGLQDYQTILPVAGKLYVFTVINYTPYSQIVVTPGCVPLSIFKPHDEYSEEDILYVECERPSAHNQYFLAKLVKDQRDLQWSYQTLTNYDDLTSNGAFQYYTDDFEQYQVYYAYARGDLLYFEGPDNGLYRFFSLPSRCAKVVRITCVDKHPHLLIECSNTSDSSVQVVNSVYLFEPDSGNYDPIFRGTAYSKCPVRFSNDGSIVGIFTGRRLLVKELFKQGRSAVIEDVTSVYDGLLTEVNSSTYAAYINTSGLYTLSVTRALGGNAVTPVRVGNSEDVCARTGCPLLEAIDTNTIVAQCNGSVATFSVHPPKLLNSSVVSNRPVRFIFYKHLPGTVPPEHPAATAFPSPSILPHPTVTSPQQPSSTIIGVDLIGQDLSLKGGGNNLRFWAFASVPVFVVGCFAIAAIVMAYQKCRHLRQNRSHSSSMIALMPTSTDAPADASLQQTLEPTEEAEPTDEPALYEVTDEPTSCEVTHEPASYEVTDEPDSYEVTDEPASYEVTDEPASYEVTHQPASYEVTHQPASYEVTHQPASYEVTEVFVQSEQAWPNNNKSHMAADGIFRTPTTDTPNAGERDPPPVIMVLHAYTTHRNVVH